MGIKKELRAFILQDSPVFTDALLEKMLYYIGDTDSELRDELICGLFYEGISTGKISHEQQRRLVMEIVNRNLVTEGIEQSDGDRVFTRTFSLLVLSLIIAEDGEESFLADEQVKTIFKLAQCYLREEQDTRGYVEGKGWAHGLAHGADLLVSVVAHPKFGEADSEASIRAIGSVLQRSTEPFLADEEGRLGRVIVVLVTRFPSSRKQVIAWLVEMKTQLELISKSEQTYATYQLGRKYHQFLVSLYFQFLGNDEFLEVLEPIKKLIVANY